MFMLGVNSRHLSINIMSGNNTEKA